MKQRELAFCTIAHGAEYIRLALYLAQDLERFHPEITLFVLTTSPSEFSNSSNVVVVEHPCLGIEFIYHSKRLVIEACGRLYESIVFMDGDCRLFEALPIQELLQLKPGIYSRMTTNLVEKLEAARRGYTGSNTFLKNTPDRRIKLLSSATLKYKLTFDEITFAQESFLLFHKLGEQKRPILLAWDELALRLSMRKFEWGEGASIGIAARKFSIDIYQLDLIEKYVFKDLFLPSEKLPRSHYNKYRKFLQDRNMECEENLISQRFRTAVYFGVKYTKFCFYVLKNARRSFFHDTHVEVGAISVFVNKKEINPALKYPVSSQPENL